MECVIRFSYDTLRVKMKMKSRMRAEGGGLRAEGCGLRDDGDAHADADEER